MTTLRVKDLPDLPGRAAWNAILGPAPAHAPLTGTRTADVVIVGSGFAGLSAARRLRQIDPNASIVVLEAGRVAEGSAGRNSGFMIDLPHELTSEDYAGAGDDRAMIALNRQAIAFAAEAVDDYRIDTNFFDRAGKINGAASDTAHAHNESYAAHLASLGEPSEMLDARAMRDLTGSLHYRSGLFTPGTVMLQPAGYIRGLAAGLSRDGVTIHEESAVTALSREGIAWRVSTSTGQISAGAIILTVNGHLESFGFEQGRLMQLFLYAVMTPELDADTLARLGGKSRWGITPADPMGTTVRRIDAGQGGNRIITRTCATLAPGRKVGPGHVARAARVMQQKFETRFPQLKGMRMQYAWAGHLCLTLNGVAVMRRLDDGLYSGCVQNGLGTARGTLTGIGAAELACGITSDITHHFTAEDSPRRLPPQPFQQIGANAVLRYKEWRAREE
ncbi:MAG: FAD-binding oxidoreductase [Roseovarius sp.]|uniref:NAD(P)/FAD-dependent oxidoreductase n=1 Tax=Roseovarius sp. TaxID=1486281 RepID=UPI001B4A2366|nr:FAD-binding oxidoreductase [Roseovarius sp.]MBQ0751053.1 FAD-binding oxidoreductase [Roseovarius sp.]MBQ0810863.1 FAD-binding oxidoreductase [Roseovarius sp.]